MTQSLQVYVIVCLYVYILTKLLSNGWIDLKHNTKQTNTTHKQKLPKFEKFSVSQM